MSRRRTLDFLVILAIFAAIAAGPTPDVNESHYLTKAKHFWNPTWLSGDLFLESSPAHWLFFQTFGRLTSYCDLPMTAWIGRAVGWIMLAWGWESLAEAVGLRRAGKIVSSVVLLALVQVANLSGEWLAGGIEAKIPAYALVFFALSQSIRGKWARVWPSLGLAIAFHPLVGGWSSIACAVVRARDWRAIGASSSEIVAAGCGVMLAIVLGVLPILGVAGSTSSPIAEAAAEIYVRERLSHHLYFWDFSRASILSFGILVVSWWELARANRSLAVAKLNLFAAMSLAFVACGIGLSSLADWDVSRNWANSWLRFYWFRLADVAVPCSVAIGLVARLTGAAPVNYPEIGNGKLSARNKFLPDKFIFAAVLVCASGICLLTVGQRWRDGRPGADRQSLPDYSDSRIRTWETYLNWVRMCRWVKANTPERAVFLVPRRQQTFKWYSKRSDLVNWKDIPQDEGIVAWKQTMDDLYGPSWTELQLVVIPRESWSDWLADRRANYVVMEQWMWDQLVASGSTPALRLVYPANSSDRTTYVLLEVVTAPPR